jgi:hypothetical protein
MRRLVTLLSVLAVVLVGVIAVGRGSSAQDATPMAATQHPLVGTWLLDTDTDDPENPLEVDIFTSDGAYISVEADGFVTLGAWEATGDQTANLTIWSPAPAEEGGGMFIVRVAIEAAADGQSLTAQYTFELIGPDGATMGEGEYGPGNASATRLTVEAMGTPVGPVEDLFAQFEEATPEASPAP